MWLVLAVAILAEVSGTLALRAATHGHRAWYALVAGGYLVAFGALGATLALGMPLGIAYGIWAASGVVLTAIAGRLLFDEPFTWLMAMGVALIVGGVLLVETGAH